MTIFNSPETTRESHVRLPELQDLRCLREVARATHFGRAARALGMSQSSLSERIKRLEHTVGAELLERTRSGVDLTPKGAAFLMEAETILRRTESAVLAARLPPGTVAPRLHIGYSLMAFSTLAPTIIRELKTAHPDLDVRMFERAGIDTEKAMFEDRLDLLIVGFPAPAPGIETLKLDEVPVLTTIGCARKQRST